METEQFEIINFYKFIIFFERLKFIFTNVLLEKNDELKVIIILIEVVLKEELILIKMDISYTELSSIKEKYINATD